MGDFTTLEILPASNRNEIGNYVKLIRKALVLTVNNGVGDIVMPKHLHLSAMASLLLRCLLSIGCKKTKKVRQPIDEVCL